MSKQRKLSTEEQFIVAAGVVGLVAAAFFACGGDDDATSSNKPDAGELGASGGRGGAGSTAANGGSGGASSSETAACEQSSRTADNTAAVVDATNKFLEALTSDQRTTVKYDRTLANAQKWSNFPTTFVQRNGVKLADMSDAAQAAAIALAKVAAGDTGSTLLSELREADEWLVSDGKASSTDYGRGLYYFSVHGTPSTSETWMLQIGGHHLAYNYVYNGKCTSATPLFDGAEPMDWTDNGTAHAPLKSQRSSSVALLAAVGSMDGAKLSGTFSDLVNGPAGGGPGGGGGGGDTKYPSSVTYPSGTTGRGAAVKGMTSEQKTLVKTVIEAWVRNVADPISNALLAEYESDDALDQTYVGYSGTADLSTQASYVRIDGPRVWIEASVQGGIVYKNIVHYHTIWRDKIADYGAEYRSQ